MKKNLMSISTGFLVDNLFVDTDGIDVDASADRYRERLIERIEYAFPDAEVTVTMEDGSGSPPKRLRTMVTLCEYAESTEIALRVDEIADALHESMSAWVVED